MRLSDFVRRSAALREAAIFEHPPEMFKAIQKWMLATYAGHVMALAELKLKKMVAFAEEVDKNTAAAEKWLAGLRDWLKKNDGKLEKATKVYVGAPGQGKWIAVKVYDDYRFLYGEGENRVIFHKEYESMDLTDILSYVGKKIQRAIDEATRKKQQIARTHEKVWGEDPRMQKQKDSELVTAHLVIKEAKKYTDKAKRYRTKAETKFPVDLSNWKYLTDYHKEEQQIVKDLLAKNKETISAAKSGIDKLKNEGQTFESGIVWHNPKWGKKIRVTFQAEGKYLVEMATTNDSFSKWTRQYAPGDTPAEIAQVLNSTTGYGKGGEKITVEAELKGKIQSISEAMEDYLDRLKGWGHPPYITATLYFDPHKKRGGQWSVSDRNLQVDVMLVGPLKSVENFKAGIAKIEGTIRHELQHVGQDALRIIKELKEDAGLPSPKIRQPGVEPGGHPVEEAGAKQKESKKNLEAILQAAKGLGPEEKTRKFKFYYPSGAAIMIYIQKAKDGKRYLVYESDGAYGGDYTNLQEVREFINKYYIIQSVEKRVRWDKPRIEHPLRDVEFHTDLGNAVDNFMSQIPGVAKKDWRKFFHAFTGSQADSRWSINWFFKSLRAKNKPKWRNAIREFTKAVQQRGFDPAAHPLGLPLNEKEQEERVRKLMNQ